MIRGRILVLAALAVSACDVPTEPPMWEQTWVVPGEQISVAVADVLPTAVTVSDDGSEFETVVPGTSFEASLAEMCSSCAAFDGLIAPKPAFSYAFSTAVDLPAAVVSASVTGDQFAMELAHDFNFDPLRPSSDPADPTGYLVIEVTSDGAVLGRDSISGDDQAFDAGTVLTPVIEIQPTDITNTVTIEFSIFSPAGDATQIEASDSLGIEFFPATITLSEVEVEAGSIAVDAPASEIDLSGVDAALVDRVQSGALRLDIENPFTLAGTLTLEFDLGARTIQKTVSLTPGASSVAVEFSGAELRDLLDAGEVQVIAEGTLAATGPGGTITVRPDDELVMESLFELVILVGGSTEEED